MLRMAMDLSWHEQSALEDARFNHLRPNAAHEVTQSSTPAQSSAVASSDGYVEFEANSADHFGQPPIPARRRALGRFQSTCLFEDSWPHVSREECTIDVIGEDRIVHNLAFGDEVSGYSAWEVQPANKVKNN